LQSQFLSGLLTSVVFKNNFIFLMIMFDETFDKYVLKCL
jgi:hypothetical protein